MLAAVASLGVLFLLIATGFETDLGLVRRLGKATTRVAFGSLFVPAVAGAVIGFAMPEIFLGRSAQRPVFALLITTALSISALPVIAAVLSQLGLMRRSISQLMVAAAMMNDVVGWVLLGVVSGLAQSGSFQLVSLLSTLAGLTALDAVDELAQEFTDRFGPVPEEVANLLYVVRVKVLAVNAGVEAIGTEEGQLLIKSAGLEMMDRVALQERLRAQGVPARVARRAIWLEMREAGGGPANGEDGWREDLVKTVGALQG